MPSKIVQGRAIRGDHVVRVYTAAQLVTLLNTYYGASAADPEYAKRVTIQLMPTDYTFTEDQLPLKIRSNMSLLGAGSQQTRLISNQSTGVGAKNVIEVSDAYSTLAGAPGRVFHVTLEGFTIVGDAYAPAGIYAKGLNHSLIHDIHIKNMTASGSIGVQLDAELGFGCYYNSLHLVAVGTAEPGGGAGSGADIGIRLKTTDLSPEPKRVNSNSLLMCSTLYCVDAGYELNGTAAITLTACEAEQHGGVGLRVLNGINTVVCGGYFENNTASDIQLGELSGASQPTQQTILLQPVLVSATRLAGLSLGSTGDVYQVADDSTSPSPTGYDDNWMDKAYVGSLSAGYIEFSKDSAATRVGYFKRSADSAYRLEMYNDGTMQWGDGSAAADVVLSRAQASVLQLAAGDSLRLNGTAYLICASASGAAADVFLSRMSADILGLDNADSFQLNSTGKLLWSTAVGSAADTGLARDEAAGTIGARLLTQAHSLRTYNTWASSTDYERAVIDWITTANTCRIGTEKGSGGGTARDLALVTDATVRITIGATSGDATFTGSVIAPAATTAIPSIRLPHGSAPTSPTDGDVWTTTTSMYARINGSTVDLGASGGSVEGTAVLSTGEVGGTKFLREDGDGTCSWQTPAGAGDMVLASAQTVTAAKTFNDTTFLLRNVADTFNGSFVNTNTADRIYTLQDAAGTIAFTSDITGTNSGTNTGDQTINALASAAYTIAVGTTGTDVNVAAAGSTITIHVPNASATARGVLSTGTQTIAGAKTFGQIAVVGLSDVVQIDTTPFATQTANQQTWRTTAGAAIAWMDANGRFVAGGNSFAVTSTFNATLWQGGAFGWGSATVSGTTAIDTGLYRDGAAGAIAARLTTTAHTFRVYKTWTDASNYERGIFGWTTIADTLTIGTQKAGSGTARAMSLLTDGTARITIGATTGLVTVANALTVTGKATFGATVKVPQTYSPSASATATLDCSLGDVHRIQMPAGDISIDVSNITDGQSIHIAITQDGTGSRTITSWFGTIRWAGGSAPTLTTTANKRDVIVIHCTGSGTYDGFIAGANI